MEFIIIILIAVIIFIVVKNNKDRKNLINKQNISTNESEELKIENIEKIPYRRKYLLTKNELSFYKSLKEVANEYGYMIIAKVRLADLIEVNKEADEKERLKYFNKIASKHIDFALCNPENMYVEYLIELDDNSHNTDIRKERDIFIEKVINKSGYSLIRVRGAGEIRDKIKNKNAISQ